MSAFDNAKFKLALRDFLLATGVDSVRSLNLDVHHWREHAFTSGIYRMVLQDLLQKYIDMIPIPVRDKDLVQLVADYLGNVITRMLIHFASAKLLSLGVGVGHFADVAYRQALYSLAIYAYVVATRPQPAFLVTSQSA